MGISVVRLVLVTAALAAIGLGLAGMTRTWLSNGPDDARPTEAVADTSAPTAEYGRRLMRETALFVGPDQGDPDMRFAGTRIACASCHLDNGTRPGTLSLLQSAPKYPRVSGRDGGMRDLKDRINGCMERSMNGRRFPRDSIELIAMENYLYSLNERYHAMSPDRRVAVEPPAFVDPDRVADVAAGEIVYREKCQTCHGWNGAGQRVSTMPGEGYVFPPLWGEDSFNNGAGMHRVLTAARFIKARMPFGDPDLTDDQAYDVAAYINSHPRPIKANLEKDFPDRADKPIDSPYPPYADDFPHEQHKYGPFRPIREYYERLQTE
jgi:thiosulfate dehydrogenase